MEEKAKTNQIAFYFNNLIDEPFKIIEKDGKKSKTIADLKNIVFPGQIIAKEITSDISDPKIIKREQLRKYAVSKVVIYDEPSGIYKTKIYGCAILNGSKIDVVPLIEVSKDALTAYMYYVPNANKEYPSIANIRDTLVELGYKGYVGDKTIEEQINKIKEMNKSFGIITVCKGVEPEDGQIEHFILLKEVRKKVGKILEDGRIDFKERDTFTPIQKGEQILEKKPFIPAKNGYDVKGNIIKGKLLGEKLFIPGKNLEVSPDNPMIYIATTNGVISISNKKVNIEDRTVIKNDIDYNTGNIKVEGTVEIFGNIKSGFEVRASSDIIVHGNVEDSILIAGANISIDNGVLGKEKAYLEAGENITVKFAQNCKMKAQGDIIVRESLIQCQLYSKSTVNVEGTVIGGQTVGKYGVIVNVAGSDKGVETKLITGIDPEIEELINIKETEKKELEAVYQDILETMKMQFGNQFLLDLKGFLAILRGSRKIKFIELLTNLGDTNKKINKLKDEINELRNKIKFTKNPTITVKEKAYYDVVIQIRKSVTKLKKEKLGPTTFKEDPETGLIIE
ncbi:MAG TPA: FapA family protein [Spirochaetota bacterium]|nr:FapA family protein [Spirochaetota bacterium]HOM38835.1 FapA family protein [Spirochaetota bacterium]HPQ49893.1 FapA family protein [Spirochaetota bacterium]